MVNSNLILELEKEGMEYKNAFKVANLMETENISKKEAIKRVTAEVETAEKAKLQKLKEENIQKAKGKK